MLLKCCSQNVIKFGNLSNVHRTEKGQYSLSNSPEKGVITPFKQFSEHIPYLTRLTTANKTHQIGLVYCQGFALQSGSPWLSECAL